MASCQGAPHIVTMTLCGDRTNGVRSMHRVAEGPVSSNSAPIGSENAAAFEPGWEDRRS